MTAPDATSDTRAHSLWNLSFQGLLFTQFLTAVNDNIFRWLVIGIGKDHVEPANVGIILTAGTACFVLPYLILAAPAGYLADRFNKQGVIVGCKVAEVIIMIVGVGAIWLESLTGLFIVVALMGAQSAIFSPSKLGAIPEILHPSRISAANGLFGLTTVSATVIGMAAGNWLSDSTGFRGRDNLALSAAVLIGVAVVGTLLSLLVRRLPAANVSRTIPWNAFAQTWRDLRTLASNRPLLRVALGIVFFWSVGALAQLNIDQFAAEGGALTETAKVPLLVALVMGVGCGSVLAGVWSAGRVELGILPLGAFGIAISAMLLFLVRGTILDPSAAMTVGFVVACGLLFVLGTSAGLFSVPLEAFLQHRSDVESRGSILAASNFLTFSGVLVSALLFSALRAPAYPGSLDNLSADLLGPALSAASEQHIAQLEAEFKQDWSAGDLSRLDALVKRAAPAERKRTLARLLWFEFQECGRENEFFKITDFYERFPADALLIKSVYYQASDLPLMTSQQIFFLAGLLTLPVFVYIVWLIPQASLRFFVWLLSLTVYRIRVFGLENLPERGGALLVPNHVSWLDGILLQMTSSRRIRMVVWEGNFQSPFIRMLAKQWDTIMIMPTPKAIVRAFREARQGLDDGDLVCIFPEGAISRSGQMQPFKPGLMKILHNTDAPVIPVYFDGLWGSIFSFERGKFFWKWPKRWPYPIQIHFGEPFTRPPDIQAVRRAVERLGVEAVAQRTHETTKLIKTFIARCKQRRFRSKVADSTGQELTGGSLLMRTLILRRLLRREVLDHDEQHVGLLLPPSAGGVIANAALTLDLRVAVNLNYTVSSEIMNVCIAQAGIKHVLTSRKFMEKMNFELDAEVVYLDDLREKLRFTDKLVSACQAYAVPTGMLAGSLGADRVAPSDVLTVIFTSGSTGTPKGVMLTHANIASQLDAIDHAIHLKSDDVILGILPFFHSMGYTVTLWTAMCLDIKGVYHFNPLDARQVGKLAERHRATILLSTPTFLRSYLRRCDKEQFAALDVVVAGAEKLPSSLCDAFEEKFGVRPVEGYGTTELSPLVSVNIPASRSGKHAEVDCKEGTVGRAVMGVRAKAVDLETGEDLPAGQPGMLRVAGTNVMKGYLGREDLTRDVIKDGWYVTGDVALLDDDGFITITGRESRFSKIGGEMVPHIKVEELLNAQVEADEEGGPKIVVTAVPDAKKGERLIVVHTSIDKSVDALRTGLSEAGLPNIFIPSADSFLEVDELPVLGTGKLDLKGIQQIAAARFSEA